MNKNNKGFSLVELIVVIAILGVCAAITTLSLSSIASSRASRCASEIDALLSRCRVSAMTGSREVYLHLYEVDELVYGALYQVDQDGDTIRVSLDELSTDATLSYRLGSAGPEDATDLFIAFDGGTGAVKNFGTSRSATPTSGTETVAIRVTSGGRTVEIGIIVPTGYHGIGG